MSDGRTMLAGYLVLFLWAIWPYALVAFFATLGARAAGLSVALVPKLAFALFGLSMLAFGLVAMPPTWAGHEIGRAFPWGLTLSLTGASIGVMAAGTVVFPRRRAGA